MNVGCVVTVVSPASASLRWVSLAAKRPTTGIWFPVGGGQGFMVGFACEVPVYLGSGGGWTVPRIMYLVDWIVVSWISRVGRTVRSACGPVSKARLYFPEEIMHRDRSLCCSPPTDNRTNCDLDEKAPSRDRTSRRRGRFQTEGTVLMSGLVIVLNPGKNLS